MANHEVKQRTDYTEGPIIASILNMGLPSMFGFLSQNIYSAVDAYWVSRLPEKEAGVAAITFFGTLLWLFFSFNQMVGPGSVAIISRRYGEKQYDLTETAIKETLFLKLFFGFIFGILGYFFVPEMLIVLGADDLALTMGTQYGEIMFLGMGIMYATYSIYTAMRGIANPKMAMILMIASNVLNIVLDPIFMFGYFGMPAWGIKGAAIASVLSYALTFAVGLYLFYGDHTNLKLHLTSRIPIRMASMWKLVKIGIPTWLGSMSFSGARLVMTPLIATFGTSVVAAYGIGNQVSSFGVMVLVGIGLGLSSLIGHNIGSKKFDRAKKTADHAILLGVGVMIAMGLISALFARPIMDIFFDSAETIGIGVTMLRIMALGFPFMAILLMIEEIHTGVGLNTPAMVVNIINAWLLEVTPVVILTQWFNYSEVAIWWVISGAAAVSSAAFYMYYRRGRWLTVEV